MKKLLFGLIATVMLSFNSFGANKIEPDPIVSTKPVCITLSCCGVGPFGIEIWTHKVCYSISTNRVTLQLQPNSGVKNVDVPFDVILAGPFSEKEGTLLVLPKGKYSVINDEIDFTPTSVAARQICITQTVDGTFFGQDYHYTIKICVSLSISSKLGPVSITPELSPELLELVRKNNNEISFNSDVVFKQDEVNTTIPAGKYYLNEDGSIYLQNYQIK